MDNTIDESNDNQQQAERISFKSKLAYGVGHILNDICASMWFTYLLVYFHLVLGFSSTSAGIILLIGQLADAIATPFVGLHSDKNDNYWLCRYGKRKTWHLTGTICVLGTFPFIFSQCIGCQLAHQWAQLIYYAAFVVIFQFGWASVQISHLSLIPDLTQSDEERTTLTVIRYSFTVASNVLVYCVTWAVLDITSENSSDKIGPNDMHKFQQIVLIGMLVGLITTIIFHVLVKEDNTRDNLRTSQEQSQRELRSPLSLFKDLELYQVAFIYMPTRLFVNLTQTYVPLYLHETLNMPATSLAIIPLILYLSSFKASLIIHYLNSKLGRKVSYLIGASMGISACIWIWFGKGDQYIHLFIYPVSLLLGSGGSMMLVTSLAITADYIGHSTENGAFIYGIMSFADKLSNGCAVMLIQYMRCTTDCTDYFKGVLSFVCGGSALLGLIMTLSRKGCSNVTNTITNYNNLTSEDAEENRTSDNA
ncbi:PREDICTED: major facilitator superfamily domain-containing protein 12-like isoform X2 [Ceratosolen solmsi marchali]|uniref:Major facilitator superfamily domain-containing protein 12-like isoform X2 n=1 Tax=Ceratosolen solmsi marchali TaxID=326594 RepID=A0AAJ6YBF0_9HYME|nr:PREDICTED: major facilitator superfamily domain-containing protein 12-like isoform X2 [Ceratosolen solmsi marchali]